LRRQFVHLYDACQTQANSYESENLNCSDAELVRASLLGDIDCFGELYSRYYRFAVGVARAKLLDLHLSEDVAQESFAIACRDLRKLQDPSRFGSWLRTIVRRAATRAKKKNISHRPLEPDQVPAVTEGTDANDAQALLLKEAVAKLPERARELINLHYFAQLSYDEIAKLLGITPEAIHGRLQRARRRLRELVEAPS
jgi:RNA polymerase sigma-70 factor (ECF subfamily)